MYASASQSVEVDLNGIPRRRQTTRRARAASSTSFQAETTSSATPRTPSVPELGHREVVERQRDDEGEERPAAAARSINDRHQRQAEVDDPRLAAGRGRAASPGPSRWFSFAHGLRARSYARCASRVRQPVDERQARVHLDREPAVRRRHEGAPGDAQRLVDEAALLRSRPPTCSITAFEKTTSNSPSAKGRRERVALDVARLRVALAEARPFVQRRAP